MAWWDCDRGGVLELDGLDFELEVLLTDLGQTVAWWVSSQTGTIVWRVRVGRA